MKVTQVKRPRSGQRRFTPTVIDYLGVYRVRSLRTAKVLAKKLSFRSVYINGRRV